MDQSFCQIWVSCGNQEEARTISRVVLERKLAACVKELPIESRYWWEGRIEHGQEVLLILETRQDRFQAIDDAMKEFHTYNTYVLQLLPVHRLSQKAEQWLNESIAATE